jgi:hypothetical protein
VRRQRAHAALLAALVLSVASAVHAQGEVIALGDGLSVTRITTWCGAGGAIPMRCTAWQPTGFAFPPPLAGVLPWARTWARVPATGRVLVALANTTSPFMYTGFAVRMLRSDDGGRTFVPVTWRWLETVALMAFEPGSLRGVAAGDSGYVWTTADGGDTWLDRGSSTGTTFTELVVVPGETVLVDAAGNAWRMSGTSFARELLVTDASVHAVVEGDAIVVRTTTQEIRIRHGHGVDRHTRR